MSKKLGIVRSLAKLREGPETHYKVRSQVGENRSVEILGSKGPWIEVRVLSGSSKGLVGWIHKDHLNLDDCR